MQKIFCEKGLRLLGLLSLFLCPSHAGSIVNGSIYAASDNLYTAYSLAFPLSSTYPQENGNGIRIPVCNHYAVNRGSVIYSPCSAQYLVAFDNYGAILPPNMCSGQTCPIAGYNTSEPTCQSLKNDKGNLLSPSTTQLFDSYCDYMRSNTRRCVPNDKAWYDQTGQKYAISPPVFSATTNWCDPRNTVQPAGPKGKISLATGESNYPFTFASATQTMALGKHTCPGDASANPGPSTNDIVMQICLPGCQSAVAPITITMNAKDEMKRKKDGWWYWKMGVWSFKDKKWEVLCDSTRTVNNLNRHLDILEVMISADTVNQFMDPTSKCMLFAPITNYKKCAGRPYVGISPGEAAAIAGCAMFALMLLLQICVCSQCIIPKAASFIQPPQQQVVYVESPQPVPQIVEKVVERVVPQTYGAPQGGYIDQAGPYTTAVLPAGQYTTTSIPNYAPNYPNVYPQVLGLQS